MACIPVDLAKELKLGSTCHPKTTTSQDDDGNRPRMAPHRRGVCIVEKDLLQI